MEKQCSIIPFSFLLGVWVRSQEIPILEKLYTNSYYKTVFKEKVCNFHRGVTQSFGIIMSERDIERETILRKGLRRGSRILLSALHLLTLSFKAVR